MQLRRAGSDILYRAPSTRARLSRVAKRVHEILQLLQNRCRILEIRGLLANLTTLTTMRALTLLTLLERGKSREVSKGIRIEPRELVGLLR